MRALALLAGLAGLALLLATATGGGHARAWPVGWTGYAPLGGPGTRLVCGAPTSTVTIVLPSGTKKGVPVVGEGASQVVCSFATATAP